MSAHDDYARAVLSILRRILLGQVDAESPPIEVLDVRDDTRTDEVLGVVIRFHVKGYEGRRRFAWTEWENYVDQSPANVGAAFALHIAVELRESVNSVPGKPAPGTRPMP